MPVRPGHGAAKGRPHVETQPSRSVAVGVPSPDGSVKRHKGKLAQLGFEEIVSHPDFKPYKDAAQRWMQAYRYELARDVGGGVCGAGVTALVGSAAWQLAASRWVLERAAAEGDPDAMALGSRLANDSRQNVLAAHELCARAAQARTRRAPTPQGRVLEAFGEEREHKGVGVGGGEDE